MKVKFVVQTHMDNSNGIVGINPVYFWLKAFYVRHGKHNIEWLPTQYELNIDEIVRERPDVLCFSLYGWNVDFIHNKIESIKQVLPDCKMIIGGPEVIRENTFEVFPWVDYAIYGDGEEAFQLLIDAIIDNDFSRCINLITREKIYPHKIFKFQDFEEYSPYVDMRDELKETHQYFINKYERSSVKLSYQRVRGCMYRCAFCNWQSGLHWKVTERKYNWKEDIDLFCEMGIALRIIDANFGLFDDDIELIKYAMKKYQENPHFSAIPGNLSKVKKDRVFKIYEIVYEQLKHDPFYPMTISLQDIDEEVLKNVNRPSAPWAELKTMLRDLRKKFPLMYLAPEIIIGLPGFNIDKFKNQLIEFADVPMSPLQFYLWCYLVNSPASDPEYQSKHNLVIVESGSSNFGFKLMWERGKSKEVVEALYYCMLYNRVATYLWKIKKKPSGAFMRKVIQLLEKDISEKAQIFHDEVYISENKIDFSKKIMYRIEHDVHELIWSKDIKQIKDLKSFVSIAWNYRFKNEQVSE